ncbi:ATP-binding cassette domain-containing protein [Limibacillus sp. MBR-115]|jgi:ATP-binding cassette subfamily F protein uup|uniref:ABC-F family ATP-binding cassette domain-containing protein n=1 Tax=Limibacillus sp. MBR-115 TaxID=3156465 RepID=UPI0033978873
MAVPLLTLQNIHLSFGGPALLEGADLTVGMGDRLCLVGRNGSGKSTLLKIAAGMIEADRGDRVLQKGVTLRYLPQEPELSGFKTTLAYVEDGLDEVADPYRARYLLEHLGLTGDEDPATLSGGEARRAALAKVLAPAPDILLLDEPTNHLDLPTIEWLESELQSSSSALVLISHDRRFLEALSRSTVWIDRGQARLLNKGFGDFESWRDDVLEQEAAERHKLDRKLVAEADWLRYGVTARRKRNQGRLRALQDLRRQRKEQRKAPGKMRVTLEKAGGSSKLVIEAEGLSKAYSKRPLIENFSTRILRGDRIGIVGPNGAGKTTLLRLLTGSLVPDAGRVKLGVTLQMVTLDQKRESLDPNWTLTEALTGGRGDSVWVGGQSRHVMSYMKDFLFSPEQARTPISRLSGGERGRLMLARAFAQPANLLVLDEPTNDLDLETLDLLQELLADYEGTVILVSHDRDFLDRVATSVIAAEGKGLWTEYAGGYSDMLNQRGTALPGRLGLVATATKPAKEAPEATPKARLTAKRKLSFKEKHALETLPGNIENLLAESAALEKKLADPQLFQRDPEAFEKIAKALEAKRGALEQAEERWLELEILRQEIEES